MLLKADKIFLENLIHFAHMGRPVTAIGLYDAGANYDRTAALVHKSVEVLSDEDAMEKAKQMRTGVRVQAVVVVKLVAEFMAGVEDLGSFCFAVKHRRKGSIFKRYALSESEHGSFHSEIMQKVHKLSHLSRILNIPSLSKLKRQLSADLYQQVERSYSNLLKQIKGAAMIYKMESVPTVNPLNPDDFVYVIYHTKDTNISADLKSKPDNRGILVKAYNKIKHRFLVIEDIDSLQKAIESQDIGLEIKYTAFSRKYKDVLDTRNITMGIANCMAEISSILIVLDSNEIDL